jgi:uncharacterized tellurite resistance protein B-like protein
MFDYLRKIITNENTEPFNKSNVSKSENRDKQLQIATAAIFIEMAKADGEISDDERELIIRSLKKRFNLSEQDINELIELSKAKLDESISLYEFSNTLNEHFTEDDKMVLLKNLWRLVYADDKLDKYEDHLIKLVGGMLKMEHKKIIDAKLLIRQELNLK